MAFLCTEGHTQLDPNILLGYYDSNSGSNEKLYQKNSKQPNAKITIKVREWNGAGSYDYYAEINITNLVTDVQLGLSWWEHAESNRFNKSTLEGVYESTSKQYRVYFNLDGKGVCFYSENGESDKRSRRLNEVAARVVTKENKRAGELIGTTKIYFAINTNNWYETRAGSYDFWAYGFGL